MAEVTERVREVASAAEGTTSFPFKASGNDNFSCVCARDRRAKAMESFRADQASSALHLRSFRFYSSDER